MNFTGPTAQLPQVAFVTPSEGDKQLLAQFVDSLPLGSDLRSTCRGIARLMEGQRCRLSRYDEAMTAARLWRSAS